MIIDQHTGLYCVIGKPIGHSLSPVMHNAAFSATGTNAVYLAFATDDVRGALNGMKTFGIKGASVTLPLKTEVLPYLDALDPMAEKIGAVNTIVNNHGRMTGYNTDGIGALKALEEKIPVSGKRCIILGAGGAARAIAFVLRENAVNVTVVNRSSERGKALAHSLGCPFVPLNKIGEITPDILIQTTPVGMYPDVDQCPVPEHILEKRMVVMDIIYNPFETRLMKLAKARGCVTISGAGMFVHQGAEQFRLWTGIDPPVDVMRHVVNHTPRKGP